MVKSIVETSIMENKVRKQELEIKRLSSVIHGHAEIIKEKDKKLDSIRSEINHVLNDAIIMNDTKAISDIELHSSHDENETIERYKGAMIQELANSIILHKYKLIRRKHENVNLFELNICLIDYNKLRLI